MASMRLLTGRTLHSEPGGWIQFAESDHTTMYAQRFDAPKPSEKAWELYSQAYHMMNKAYPQE